MKQKLTCILCPRGCGLTADVQGQTVTITGNSCPKGAEYGKTECLHPVRTVTTTLRIANRCDTMVCVKTETPIPRERMADAVAQIRQLTVNAPVRVGDALPVEICGSRILITKAVM